MIDNAPTVGSLFSGIGGIDLGLERAGFRIAWQCEIDPWSRRVLAKHWPDVQRFEDVHDLDESVPWVDVLAGGFPCQPVSLAGKGLAQDDPRWLWPEFARFIRMVRPQLVFVENVPGLFRRGFGDVIGDLAACGYDAEWDCIPASAVGAPHRRDRVWVVAHSQELIQAVRGNESPSGRFRLWPTPLARDSRTFAGAQRAPNAQGSEPLTVQVGGTLNPTFVEWLMGYPKGWTEL